MTNENYDPFPDWGVARLAKLRLESKDDLLFLARRCPPGTPFAASLNAMMDRSYGPDLAQIHDLRDTVDKWRNDGAIAREWVVFALLDLALQHATEAPTALEASHPFMTALARAVEPIKQNKVYRDEHWTAEYGAGDCVPNGPPREPSPSWIDSAFLRQAETESLAPAGRLGPSRRATQASETRRDRYDRRPTVRGPVDAPATEAPWRDDSVD